MMKHLFSVGQFVRARALGSGIHEVVRVLPLLDDGMRLYVVKSARGVETVARHEDLELA